MTKEQVQQQIMKCRKKITQQKELIKELEQKIEKSDLLVQRIIKQQRKMENELAIRQGKLTKLISISPNSNIARKYYDGMSQLLQGIEYKRAYQKLEDTLYRAKKQGYQFIDDIDECTQKIGSYQRKIDDLKKQLSILNQEGK